jgi:hypothetical protein
MSMTWILIAALGFAAWWLVALFFLALCHFAGQADDITEARLARDGREAYLSSLIPAEASVVDLRAFRESLARRAA